MKYFSKDFLRFTIGFLIIVAVSLLLIMASSVYASSVSKIVFTTEPQNIKPNIISEGITIQTQDDGGNSLSTNETLDLELTSTSLGGEFLNSSGNPVSTTMNKGTANRTFYYRDSKEGSFTITVKAIGRETAEVWIATQLINVGSGSASQSQGQVLGDSTVTSNTGSQSATAGAVAPTYATPASQLEVSAGGDRLTAPGSPISFQALIKKNASGNGGLTFAWSFGDGEVGDGSLVTHTYKYPGEYAVILNVKAGNVFGVSRLKVKVMVPEISVSERDDYIEITNNAGSEVNLFNWKIIANHRAFIFQPDTIVLPKTSIKVDKKLLLLKGEVEVRPTLKNFLGQVVARSPKLEIVDPDYQNGSSNINTKTSLINTNSINQRSKKETGVVAGESVEYQQVLERPTTTEPLGKVIYESKKSENFFEKIKGFLGRLFD